MSVLAVVMLSGLTYLSLSGEVNLPARAALAYARGIRFLRATQGEAGDFPTSYWPTGDMSKTTPVGAVFTTSQILYASASGSDE